MLVMVGVGLQEQLADIAATQVRDARLVPGYSAEVRRAPCLAFCQGRRPHDCFVIASAGCKGAPVAQQAAAH